MKKTRILLPLLLVLAVVITSLVIFTGTAGADATNATYTSRTVTRGSLYITAFGTLKDVNGIATGATGYNPNGDFETLAAKLATISPTEETFYKLTLTTDVVLKNPVNIAVNEFTEVVIDLAGHKLTTECGTAAFVVSGSGGIVRIVGQYTNEGEWAPVVYNQTAGALVTLTEGSDSQVILKNLDIDMSSLSPATSLVSLSSGEFILNSCEVTYNSIETGSMSMITASGGASVAIKNSTFNLDGAMATTTAISLTGADGYFEKSVINADRAIYSDTQASNILSVATDIVATEPFVLDSSSTRLDILGGRITTTGDKIVAGDGDKSLVKFWYGDGETVITGENPSRFAVQADCKFTESADGSYVLAYTGTTSSSSMVMKTIATVGSAPTVTSASSISSASLPNGTNKYEKSTAYIVTSLGDCVNTGNSFSNVFHTDERLGIIVDFNGYTTTLQKSGNHDAYGGCNYYMDGAGVDGKKGGLTLTSSALINPMFLRARIKASYSGACMNFNLVLTDCVYDLEFTPSGDTNTIFAIQNGDITIDGCEFIYGGADVSFTYKFISVDHSHNPGYGWGRVRDTTFRGNVECENVAALSTGSGTGKYYVDGMKTEGVVATDLIAETKAYIRNSEIRALTAAYRGAGKTYVYDTKTTVLDGKVGTGTGPVFCFGEGNNVIYTNGQYISGNYSCESGYGIGMTDIGVYKVLEGSMCASITLPAVYHDGMVLQRNKPINIRGYCNTEGSVVEVSIGGNTAYATVKDGEWMATLPPMEAAFNQTIRIVEHVPTENLIEIKDVNIGEVWVMTGQSNGNLETFYLEDVVEYAELANALQNVRIYKGSQGYTMEEQKYGSGTWYTETTPARVKSKAVSAIGYVAAAKIAVELGDDVPVAIMHVSRGATKIKTWLDYETLKEVSPSAADEYDYYHDVVGSLPDNAHAGAAVGSVIYNNFIAPLKGYSVAGVMWYQGEGDTGGEYFAAHNKAYLNWAKANGKPLDYEEDKDNCYTEFFYALEKVFRRDFGNDPELPVYVMQLSPFESSSYETVNLYNFKIEQYEMCKNEPNTHLVSLATDGAMIGGAFFATDLDPDLGAKVEAQGFIHPIRKSTVGIRTADLILANEYGIQYADVFTHPEPISAVAKNGVLTVTFDTELEYFYGSSAQGFEIYNGTAWVKATGYIDGNKVILTAEGVTDMTRVRYGCGEMLMELRDGEIIEVVTGSYKKTDTTQLRITYNGKDYYIDGDTTDMIRSLDYGNITNASGVPLVIFGLDIVTE